MGQDISSDQESSEWKEDKSLRELPYELKQKYFAYTSQSPVVSSAEVEYTVRLRAHKPWNDDSCSEIICEKDIKIDEGKLNKDQQNEEFLNKYFEAEGQKARYYKISLLTLGTLMSDAYKKVYEKTKNCDPTENKYGDSHKSESMSIWVENRLSKSSKQKVIQLVKQYIEAKCEQHRDEDFLKTKKEEINQIFNEAFLTKNELSDAEPDKKLDEKITELLKNEKWDPKECANWDGFSPKDINFYMSEYLLMCPENLPNFNTLEEEESYFTSRKMIERIDVNDHWKDFELPEDCDIPKAVHEYIKANIANSGNVLMTICVARELNDKLPKNYKLEDLLGENIPVGVKRGLVAEFERWQRLKDQRRRK
ncbi:MAG: hypothetical protein IKS61_01525 [Aeriscardovia sp.]|nr:hypothetical protein [Aeriscardovia sp.]